MGTTGQILLLGAGGHAASCVDVIECHGKYSIAGLLGLESEVGKSVAGCRVVGTDNQLADFLVVARFGIVTVGQINSPELRIELFARLVAAGLSAPAIISPLAYVSPHARIGSGTIVMHGAIVNAGAWVGDNCIINTRALVEHDARVENHCHISTGAILNGNVKVGEGSFVGSGAVVREQVTIGSRCKLGMGTRVMTDVADRVQLTSRR